ncbi:MAG: hypothetical protein ACU0CB_14005 [Roseovarius sp.]|uniref:hypothetical protein n=1 Tax=Roseovarius sp. TaxID=1486281 RepID=UPI002630A93D|nr:hypothetical protein [Roseovarius sp.]
MKTDQAFEIAFKRAEKAYRNMTLGSNVSHSELDAIDLILDAAPQSFSKVIRNIMLKHPRSSYADRNELIERLHSLLVTQSEFFEVDQGAVHGPNLELIPTFELSEKETARILELCIGMRKIVFASSEFDQPHKVRLLNRIAAIEAEVQKPRGIFDVVRGGMNDLGETLGKFGTDIKPLTDRMREVVDIARRKTTEYDQIPGPEEVKQLPPPSEEIVDE